MARTPRSQPGWQARQHAAEGVRQDEAVRRIRDALQDAVPVLLACLLFYVVFFQGH